MIVGAYIKHPMNNFTDRNLSDDWHGGMFFNENSTKLNTSFTTSVFNRTFDGNATIKVDLNKNATGLIYFSFLNGTALELVNGSVQHKVSGLARGCYSFSYYYTGDDNYNSGVDTGGIVIPSPVTTITPVNDNITMYYKDGTQFEVTLKDSKNDPLSNKNVTFEINGVSYVKTTDNNGSASLKLNIAQGSYDLITYYRGTQSTQGNLTHSRLVVLPTISGKNITKLYRNGTQYYIQAITSNGSVLANQTIRFNINGVFYNRTTDENGTAKLNINLEPKSYIITAENLNDGCKISNDITVTPSIISDDLTKIYRNGTQFNVRALKNDGTPLANSYLLFNIHGVLYNRPTNATGHTKLNINLEPGTYVITTENPNDGSKISNVITVTPYLFTTDLVKYYKNASRFTVKLVDNKYNPISGQEVTFKINGVQYTKTTNNNGEAGLAINLMPGQYEITTKSSEYEVNNMITVLPTLIDNNEHNVTLNMDEGELYDVQVVDGNGNAYPNQEVTFKYLNQVNKVKTDENGTARFEGYRINQFNEISIEYNGYTVYNNAFFKKYPYGVFDKVGDGLYEHPLPDIISSQISLDVDMINKQVTGAV